MANNVQPQIVKELAPSGKLRAAINFGNTVLVQKDPAGGEPHGVSPDLARELARRLHVPIEFVPFEQAGKVFEALQRDAWDIAFLAIDPLRAAGIDFTAPYVQIEGAYVVPSNSALRTNEDVDREGVRVAAGTDSAYDLYLTRNLKNAKLFRDQGLSGTVAMFLRDRLDVLAGVKQQMAEVVKAHPELRMIPGRFMVIEQAMGTPKGRAAGARYLRGFVEEMKASGFVAKALSASGQHDAVVAPAAAAK